MVQAEVVVPRMLRLARQYLSAANKLARTNGDFGQSGPLLNTIALEILLKAAHWVEKGAMPSFGHCYREGFNGLSGEAQSSIIAACNERYAGHVSLDQISVLEVLDDFQRNFKKGRYHYEENQSLADADLAKKGIAWAESGGALEDADFRYHPMEMDGLCEALISWIESHQSNKAGSAKAC